MTKGTIKRAVLGGGLLAGTVIGAGLFSLPYAFKTSGLLPGFFFLGLAAGVYVALYYMYADIIRATEGERRFVGYARMYLGKFGSAFAVLSSVVQAVLVLTIYLILSQSFADLITGYGAGFHKLVIFWALSSAAIFLEARRIAWLELLIAGGMIAIIALIFFAGLPAIPGAAAANAAPVWPLALVPLAPVLFSLSGRSAVIEVVKENPEYKRSIALGIIVPAAVYALFALAVIGISGHVTPDAIGGLAGHLPIVLLALTGVLGILSLASSYIAIGYDVYKSMETDLALPVWTRFLVAVFGPIALYLAGLTSFLKLIGIVGGVFLALEGILMVIMWSRALRKKLQLHHFAMMAMFAIALVYEIMKV